MNLQFRLKNAILLAALGFAFGLYSSGQLHAKPTDDNGTGPVLGQLNAGDYTPLLLGIDPQDKAITGYFEDRTGGGNFNCIFFLRGKVEGEPPYRIQTWFPKDTHKTDIINGRLWPETKHTPTRRMTNGQPAMVDKLEFSIRLELDSEPGGCANATPYRLAQKGGDTLPQESAADWHAIRVVASKKAFLHNAPTAGNQRKGYLTEGDAVRVIEHKPDWVSILYRGDNGRDTRGWLKASDLFPDQPPQR